MALVVLVVLRTVSETDFVENWIVVAVVETSAVGAETVVGMLVD